MSAYKYSLDVDIHDIDYNGVARASALLKYMQTAAQSQLTYNGMTYENLYSQNRAFLLSRIRIEFDEPVRAYQKLTATSFPCESRGYSFLRCYKLERDGITICRAASLWALINTDTRALVRVNDFALDLPLLKPLDLTINRFRMPDNLTDVGTYQVTYGTVDQNRHMNNTTYPDMYSSFLPLNSKRFKSITINYANEAPMGEVLRVQKGDYDGIYYFRTIRSDGKINSEAEIELTDIK